jgi:glutamine amidotransferase
MLDPPHGLLRQSYAPKDMRGGGTINADGFGVGWYADGAPVRYRSGSPLWTDTSFASLAVTVRSGAVLGAVRSATVGMPVNAEAAAPFADDGYLFSHNGLVAGWPYSMEKLAGELPVTDLLTLDAPTDAALLWALLRHRLRDGTPPAEAIRGLVRDVRAAAPGSRLNLMLTDGQSAWATTVGHALSVRTNDLLLLASEPLDDGGDWAAVPDERLVVAGRSTYTVEELCG